MAHRYRCGQCGNLTRFDVVVVRRSKEYHHFTIGGELRIEDEIVVGETFEEVTCRWCGDGNQIEKLEVPSAAK